MLIPYEPTIGLWSGFEIDQAARETLDCVGSATAAFSSNRSRSIQYPLERGVHSLQSASRNRM